MPADANWTSYGCGMRALHARGLPADAVAGALATTAARIGADFCLVFSSDPAVAPQELAERLAAAAPQMLVCGCSTAGELAPGGIAEGSLLAILFPREGFAVSSLAIEDVSSTAINEIAEAIASLRRCHLSRHAGPGRSTFAVSLIDGLSHSEERVTSAVFWGLDDIPLIGGSAGDGLAFEKTLVIAEGSARSARAVVALITTDVPFHIFKSDNFLPMDTKFVVTASDPDRRRVMELNARPAAAEYAAALGAEPAALTHMSFATNPLVVRVGGEYYCRSIRSVGEDGSLVFHCAIDDGVVLTLAEARGMLESTRLTLDGIDAVLGGIDLVLGFDCFLRRVDAENRQVSRKMNDLYRSRRVIGFGTYGEQYRSMHLNQTLTGIAFGRAAGAPPAAG